MGKAEDSDMTNDTRPIGFFDSGLGGVSVLRHAADMLPCENFIYFGDDKNAPYGTKTEREIKALTLKCGEFLYQKGVKALVMACNTATSAAVKIMREKYQLPVISIEPAVKPAMEHRPEGSKVLVLATPATISQQRYQSLLNRLGAADDVINVGCERLAGLIEQGNFEDPGIGEYLNEKLNFLKNTWVSGVVIGCTHYSFVVPTIGQVVSQITGQPARIFDGMYGTVRQLRRVLKAEDLQNTQTQKGSIQFYTSGGEQELANLKAAFAKFIVPPEQAL